VGTDFDDIFTGSSAFIWSGFGVDKWGVTSIMNFWNMSLHCPQCGGLVYARSQRNCGFCGAELPPDFAFSEAEKAAIKAEEEERIKAANTIKKPVFPRFSLACYFICAVLAEFQAVAQHSHVWAVVAACWGGVVIERVIRFFIRQRRFVRQSRSD
jgi:hypothetical protein